MGRIAILCGDFTEDYELAVPFHCLKMLGHDVITTSPGKVDGQYITTCIHDFNERYQAITEWEGHRFRVDIALNGPAYMHGCVTSKWYLSSGALG
ncbi:hypothetical protein [Microbulbifer epialgicus]|uniref:DJ-1/PfpI family protein n=1 Tax=Microbulbifer epialgicus TaxID=393907 RepID=A0ABV4P4W8_9GAMM